jgi:RNA polymerase sporulation-specific sigma factor
MFANLLNLLKRVFFFTGYFTNSSYPKPLSAEEEVKCLNAYKEGDSDAREKLICHNMRLVAHIAKKYNNTLDTDDLISIGSIGLIKGIESYKQGKGTTLATYLARCIENEILMTLRSNKRYKNTVYLNEQLGIDSDGNEFTLMDVLAVGEESVFSKVELSILKEKLLELIETHLNQREQQIILLRFGLLGDAPLTQLQTAERLNISRSYISRIETKALVKLRGKMSVEDM